MMTLLLLNTGKYKTINCCLLVPHSCENFAYGYASVVYSVKSSGVLGRGGGGKLCGRLPLATSDTF